MLGRLRKVFSNNSQQASNEESAAPTEISVGDAPALPLPQFFVQHEYMPILDGHQLANWLNHNVAIESHTSLLDEVKHAWLLHVRDALGENYQLEESSTAMVLSSLEPTRARTSASFLSKAREQVLGVLAGIAQAPQWGKDVLIVFDDAESYYCYLSFYYPDAAARGLSRAMYIRARVGHFVAVKADLYASQSMMVQEMTRNCLAHLPLPLWLNVGTAVNTERQLVNKKSCGGCGTQQLHDRLLAYWNESAIQEFWSGASFQRVDEGLELSYELARIMVELLAKDWQSFRDFATNVHTDDAGAAAARAHLDIDLGELVCALLERAYQAEWSPASQLGLALAK
ncbi:MAG: hypothetical protein WA632_09920 [Gallionella sp.]